MCLYFNSKHSYCGTYLLYWINLCEIVFRYLREEDEYKDLLYVNYEIFKNDVSDCEIIDLRLPFAVEPIQQYHRTCFGCSKVISVDNPYINNDISIYPINDLEWERFPVIVLRKVGVNNYSGQNEYELLDCYAVSWKYVALVPVPVINCQIPKSKRRKEQVNDVLFGKVDELINRYEFIF